MKSQMILTATAGLCLLVATFTAAADDSASLGAAWPSAPDVSRSAYHHVYRWQRQGVVYVQVNAANGQPQMAFAYSVGGHLVLPVGAPDRVNVDLGTTSAPSGSQPVFDDGQVAVVETASGFNVISSPTNSTRVQALDQATCNGDPLECTRAN